jgi:hypothetical protein
MRRLLPSLIALALGSSAAAADTVTLSFERVPATDKPPVAGTAINGAYDKYGIQFTNAIFARCPAGAGACPPPMNGYYASVNDRDEPLGLGFTDPQTQVSFYNVANSGFIVVATNEEKEVVAKLTNVQGAMPDFKAPPLVLKGKDIAFITFTLMPGSRGFGFDDLTFTPTAPVPEPGSWGLLIMGCGLVGWRLRRERRLRHAH